jgi:hypothetical protein
MIGELEVSEAYASEVRTRADLTVIGDLTPLAFDVAGRLLPRG